MTQKKQGTFDNDKDFIELDHSPSKFSLTTSMEDDYNYKDQMSQKSSDDSIDDTPENK